MQGNFSFTVLLVLLGVMIHLPYGKMQRSPYVPMPVNLPGLLPRFGGAEDNSASSGGQAASSSSSSTGNTDFSRPTSGGSDLGARVGDADIPDVRQSRPVAVRGSGISAGRCPPQQVPCYDCMVYISSSGQITKFTPEGKRF